MKYILAIDQGTTGTTAALIRTDDFSLSAQADQEYPQIYPSPGQVEHDLDDIWRSVEATVSRVLKENAVAASDIIAIGITNQRETTCAFDSKGNPLARAIVWQDRRTSPRCQELAARGMTEVVKKKTGLTLDPYFSSTKMEWLLQNVPKVREAAGKGDLRLGNIDAFLLFKLTGGRSFATEATNASRTMLMDLKTGKWDESLMDLFGVNAGMLPEIRDSFGPFGATNGLGFLPDGIPITGILGDQQAALYGQAAHAPGGSKCTYGTGAFMLVNTGEQLKYSKSGLLSTVAYRHKGKLTYALEGSCYIAGAAVQWLRDNVHIIERSRDVEALARKVTDLAQVEHVLFLPFFTGIGSPHWRPEAKAAILGLTRGTNETHMAWACLEGMALSINDLVEAFRKDTGMPVAQLRVDGGAVENDLLMEMQATFSGAQIIRPKVIETTAYGAALAAAVGQGLIEIQHIDNLWKKDRDFTARPEWQGYQARKRALWSESIRKLYF